MDDPRRVLFETATRLSAAANDLHGQADLAANDKSEVLLKLHGIAEAVEEARQRYLIALYESRIAGHAPAGG